MIAEEDSIYIEYVKKIANEIKKKNEEDEKKLEEDKKKIMDEEKKKEEEEVKKKEEKKKEAEEEKKKEDNQHPDLTKLRPILFWDTKIEKINWLNQKNAVIKRVFERGNTIEKNEIYRFYGKDVINEILASNGKRT